MVGRVGLAASISLTFHTPLYMWNNCTALHTLYIKVVFYTTLMYDKWWNQGRTQEFVHGVKFSFLVRGGISSQHPLGPVNPLETIDFTGLGEGGRAGLPRVRSGWDVFLINDRTIVLR